MTAGRRLKAVCGRCQQQVEFETTGYPYGPLIVALPHDLDGKPCLEKPVLFHHELVEVKPMEMPTTLLLDLEYQYGKNRKSEVEVEDPNAHECCCLDCCQFPELHKFE